MIGTATEFNVNETARTMEAVATPALFAQHISRRFRMPWILALHLAIIDAAIIDTIRAGENGDGAPILVVEAPPRHGKSELICRYLPPWYLGTFPDRRVLLAMNSAKVSRSYGRKARDIVKAHGRSFFGVSVRDDVSAADDWSIADREGGMISVGVGSAIGGRGAHLLIVDDPIRSHEEASSESQREDQWNWWQSEAQRRLEPGGCAVIVSTRWHEDDISGRLIRNAASEGGTPVRRVRLPAIAEKGDILGRSQGEALWPQRFPLTELLQFQADMSPWIWNALYQQKPGRHEGAMFPDYYFDESIWVDQRPEATDVSTIAVDPSIGRESKPGDPSALVYVGLSRGLLYVWADIERRPPQKIVADTIAIGDSMNPTFLGIEANGFQSILSDVFDLTCQLNQRPPLRLSQIVNTEAKGVRILRLDRHLARKIIRFVRCPGCVELVKQLRMFPDSSYHDDGPDALEMAIRLMEQAAKLNTVPEEEALEL